MPSHRDTAHCTHGIAPAVRILRDEAAQTNTLNQKGARSLFNISGPGEVATPTAGPAMEEPAPLTSGPKFQAGKGLGFRLYIGCIIFIGFTRVGGLN